ncbi:MAG TPA: hypothetical protein DCF44_00940 [Chitinophagaceae bacterium]|nr:hypothetical protein [Chitinophagaceae bacterium]
MRKKKERKKHEKLRNEPEGHCHFCLLPLNTYTITNVAMAWRDFLLTTDDEYRYISLKGNKIVLRSKRLNKEIIPRLTNAHNHRNCLHIYSFLCDLQTQYFGKSMLDFSWDELYKLGTYFPRVVYKQAILAPEIWFFNREEFDFLKNGNKFELFNDWRIKNRIPSKIYLANGDNKLFLDLTSKMCVEILIEHVLKSEKIVLSEFIFDINNPFFRDSNGNGFTNECFIFRKNHKQFQTSVKNNLSINHCVKRKFIIGDNWIYFKLFCGYKSAEKLLLTLISDLVKELKSKQLIDKWFFVRYFENDWHLRVRFHLISNELLGEVIKIVNSYALPYIEKSILNKIQTDTYVREIERYGAERIEIIEEYFHSDSELILSFLHFLNSNCDDSVRWQYAIYVADSICNSFHLTLIEKIRLFQNMSNEFIMEHGGDKGLKIQLDKLARTNKSDILNLLMLENKNGVNGIKEHLEIRKNILVSFAKHLDLSFISANKSEILKLIPSLIHMSLNRLFISRQRTNEMVVYYLLFKNLKTIQARNQHEFNHEH